MTPDPAFDLLPDPAIVVDHDTVVRVNRACAALLERPVEELTGLPLAELVDDLELVRDRWAHVSETGQSIRIWARGARGRVAIDVRAGALGDERFVVTGRSTVGDDRLESLIGRLSGLYMESNRGSIADIHSILLDNRALFDGLGWNVALYRVHGEVAELEHMLFYELGDDDAASAFSNSMRGRRLPLSSIPNVGRVVETREGHFVWDAAMMGGALAKRTGEDGSAVQEALEREGLRRAAFAPIFANDEVDRVLLVLGAELAHRDFAAVQLLAAILSAAQQVSELSHATAMADRHAALGQMAAQLAHEVRNPLAVILQAARQVSRHTGDDENVRTLLGMIHEEASRLDRLVDDLVDFAGPLDVRPQPVFVAQVVRWSLESCRNSTPRELEVDVAIDPELTVLSDPRCLQAALAHVLRNAHEHAHERLRVHAHAEGANVLIDVDNDGSGVEPDLCERMFEPFYTTRAAGSGLGLAVARRMLHEQGGTVEVTGFHAPVRFTVTLPAP